MRLDGRVVVLAHAVVLERGGGEVGQLGEDLEVVAVELAVVADDRRAQHAAHHRAGLDRHRDGRVGHLVLDGDRSHKCAVVRQHGRAAGHEHLTHDALVRADPRPDQVPRHAVPGSGDRQPRIADVAHEQARPVHARDPARVARQPLEDEAAVAGLGERRRAHPRAARAESPLVLSSLACHQPHDQRFPRAWLRKLERLSSRPATEPFPDKAMSPPVDSRGGMIRRGASAFAEPGRLHGVRRKDEAKVVQLQRALRITARLRSRP